MGVVRTVDPTKKAEPRHFRLAEDQVHDPATAAMWRGAAAVFEDGGVSAGHRPPPASVMLISSRPSSPAPGSARTMFAPNSCTYSPNLPPGPVPGRQRGSG